MTCTAGRRLARIAVAAAVILVAAGATAVGQTDPNIFVNVTSRQDKAADAQFGEDFHQSLRDTLENRMFNGLKKAYPCIHYLDMSAARQMLGVERTRELLGGEGESRLPAIANAVGAGTLGTASVTLMGGTVVITGSMMDTSSAKTIGRAQAVVPAGDTNAIYAAMDRFVSQLVASAGADGPKCGGWQGEISAVAAQHEKGKNPNGDPFTMDIDLKIACQIGKGGENEPPCQLSVLERAGRQGRVQQDGRQRAGALQRGARHLQGRGEDHHRRVPGQRDIRDLGRRPIRGG